MKFLGLGLLVVIAVRGAQGPSHTIWAAAVDIALAALLTLAFQVGQAPSLQAESQPASSSIRRLAYLAPTAVFLQVCLGALYRHEIWGILPHMAGAAIAVSVALILCVLLLQHHPEFQRQAVVLMTVVLTQVALGIATFILRLLDLESTMWFKISSTAHIALGAITLGVTVLLGRLVIGNPAPHRHDPRPENQ